MTFDLDLAIRCQRALDNAASARLRPLPEVAADFGHSPAILDRVAYETAKVLVAICKRRKALSDLPNKESAS